MKFWMWLAWALPRPLVYWATIRLVTWECEGSPADRSIVDSLKVWRS
jgi:hypothetical protein